MGDKKRIQIDEELVKGCQRYLDELERRSAVLQKVKDEQREVERQKSVRREHWRRFFYGDDSPLTVVILLLLMIGGWLMGEVQAQTSTTEVLLETTAGNIRIALYDETPQHRDNFLKLTKMGSYDSLLFHRVIKDFMIQSGDINSKHAKPGQLLGTGDYDYTQEPEFRLPQIFHRRGVVAMAREGDKKNPERRSAASQFYIVWGKIYDDRRLAKAQERLDSATQGQVKLTPEMMEVYKTQGGTPHLDGQYTVFGEISEGMDIVEKIQMVKTDKNDRPLEDIRIIKASVTKDVPEKPKPKVAPKKPVKRPVRRR